MKLRGAKLESRIEVLLEEILPALDGIDTCLPGEALLDAAVEANVRRTVHEISRPRK